MLHSKQKESKLAETSEQNIMVPHQVGIMSIPFNVPYTCIESSDNIRSLIDNPTQLANQTFKKECVRFFEERFPNFKALLTSSCTSAMELIALSMGFGKGDEVIMPSFGFVGVANAFANTGASPVFVDIIPSTMNIDPESIVRSITPATRAVVIVHYAGVACATDTIRKICDDHGLLLIEDSAQGIGCSDKGKPMGSMGDFSCISFDSLKNISCGEGGLLLCKEYHWPKVLMAFNNGTNREAFERKQTNCYEWVAAGSKFEMSEFSAAILHPLLINSESILWQRRQLWQRLYDSLLIAGVPESLLPTSIANKPHNGHLFYIKCSGKREELIEYLQSKGIPSAFHYSPLHSSTRAKKEGWKMDCDTHTTIESGRLLRLPIHNFLTDPQIGHIATTLVAFLAR